MKIDLLDAWNKGIEYVSRAAHSLSLYCISESFFKKFSSGKACSREARLLTFLP